MRSGASATTATTAIAAPAWVVFDAEGRLLAQHIAFLSMNSRRAFDIEYH
jgi:hypothetical protein